MDTSSVNTSENAESHFVVKQKGINFKREDPEWKTGLAVLCRRDSGLLVVLCPIDA